MFKTDFEFATRHPVLQKHIELLQELNDDRVMCICYQENKECKEFYIEEQCDEYFKRTLTKAECIELSELFKEIAENL